MTKLSTLIQELHKIKDNKELIDFPQLFDEKLFEIFQLGNPDVIGELLLCLDDEFEYEELMFSIIHTIETFNDAIYVEQVISNLKEFYNRTPEWASVVHRRIINSQSTFETYLTTLKKAAPENKKALKLLLNRILNEEEDKEVDRKLRQLLQNINNERKNTP